MERERLLGILEEFQESESVAEVRAMLDMGGDYLDPAVATTAEAAIARLTAAGALAPPPPPVNNDEVRELERKIAELTRGIEPPRAPAKSGRRYRMLSFDGSWSTKPQVLGILAVLAAHAEVGDVLDEEDILAALDANRAALSYTRQPVKRIWDYYRGDWNEGLSAHGNIEKA